MRKNGKLAAQVIAIIAAMFILMAAICGITVYVGSRDAYLTAKNTAMSSELMRIVEYFDEITENSWYISYWAKHPEEVSVPMTNEERIIAYEKLGDETPDDLIGIINTCTEEEKLALAKEMYDICQEWINAELDIYDYDGLYFIDVSEADRGSVFFEANKTGVSSRLGDKRIFVLNDHPAIGRLLSDKHNDTEFETVTSDDYSGGNYYIGYKPLMFQGEVKAVVCMIYNWDVFHNDLIKSVSIITLVSAAVILVTCALILLLLRRLVVIPIGTVQDSVHDYITDKDSAAAAERIDRIKANNEIGRLSDNVKELILDIDKYIGEISSARDGIRTLFTEVMEALARTIDAKDKYTNGHSERVAIYSRMLGRNLGLPEKDLDNLYYMGLLHDIGKIGIPHDIISKAAGLTDEEYTMMKDHTLFGYDILSGIKSLPVLAEAARWHHEYCDGSGYPDKLTADQIPFMVKIITVADSYDAMTSNRSYRKYLPQDVVRAEIAKNAGTQFDTKIAECMLAIIDADKGYSLHE